MAEVEVEERGWGLRFGQMSVTEILKELPKLSAKDLAQVFRLVHDLEARQRMSGRQLTGLAEKLSHTTDPKDAARLREEIGRGFYGTPP